MIDPIPNSSRSRGWGHVGATWGSFRATTGFTLEYELDASGRLVSVPGYVDEVGYDARGKVARLVYANGAITERTYDQRIRLSELVSTLPDGFRALDFRYGIARTGQVLAVEDLRALPEERPSAEARYEYDALYRLRAAHLDPGRGGRLDEQLRFELNTVGNMTEVTSSLGEASIAHIGEVQYGTDGAGPHAPSLLGSHGWRYDAAGHLLAQNDQEQRHEWDFMGRLTRTIRDDAVRVESAYGATRDRVQKRDDQHFVEYVTPDFEVRDGVGVVYVRLGHARLVEIERIDLAAEILPDLAPESGSDGRITAGDAWMLHARQQGLLAGGAPDVDTPWAGTTEAALGAALRRMLAVDGRVSARFYHCDHRGSVAAVSDAEGELVALQEAYPYGAPRGPTQDASSYTFTGQERDAGSGLSYHAARHLATRLGAWTSPDPHFALLDSEETFKRPWESVNPYTYGLNDPIALVDPSGEVVETVWDVINVMVGAQGLVASLAAGDYGWAVVDGLGLIYDVAATVTPGLPAGGGAVRNAGRVIQEGRRLQGLLRQAARRAPRPLRPALRRMQTVLDDALTTAQRYVDEAAETAGGGPRLPRSVGAAANITTRSRIGESSFAVRQARSLSQAAQRDVDNLLSAFRAGNSNPGIGTRRLGGGFYELRGRNAGRVIVREVSSGIYDIVGKFQGHVRGDAANSAIIQRFMRDYNAR